MLEHNPILRERLSALGVFSGIAIAAVSGFELVVGAGLDPITPSFISQAPSEYTEERVMRAWHYDPYQPEPVHVVATDHYLGYPLDGYEDANPRIELAGGYDDASAARDLEMASANDFELYDEIARLYAESEAMLEEETAGEEPVEPVEKPQPLEDAEPEFVTPQPLPDFVLDEATAEPAPVDNLSAEQELEGPGADLSAYGNASP